MNSCACISNRSKKRCLQACAYATAICVKLNKLYSLYNRYVPAEYKSGALNALLHKAWKICTNNNQFDVEVNKIRDKFNKLCYPILVLGKYVKNFIEKKIVTRTDETTNNKREEIIIRLSFIGDITKSKT